LRNKPRTERGETPFLGGVGIHERKTEIRGWKGRRDESKPLGNILKGKNSVKSLKNGGSSRKLKGKKDATAKRVI